MNEIFVEVYIIVSNEYFDIKPYLIIYIRSILKQHKEEERTPDEDADALTPCENKDKTKPSVSKPAKKRQKNKK